ncbi:MAG TPA: ATP-dependent metallopeptidase FtsH/Yme1/Tma family protein, partial [Steroidobacter sp.]|nr:ATP-dependent metallopeptidase FtsH/Yme1/Tma family protein [Steroidobacter sp.]
MNWPTPPVQRTRDAAPGGRVRPASGGSGAPQGAGRSPNMPTRRTWMTFLIILALNYFLMRLLFPGADEAVTIPYTAFKEQVAKHNVASIYSKGASIEGRFIKPVTWPPESKENSAEGDKAFPSLFNQAEPRSAKTFTTTLPAFVDTGLEAFMIAHDVEISAIPIQGGSPWATLLYGFGPALLFIGFYVWLYRRAAQQGGGMGGALMGIGKSRARRYDQQAQSKVTFNDVAGIDEAENELVEIV